MTDQLIVSIGILLIVAGIILAFLSVIPSLRSGDTRGRGGAVVIIGPFPIVLGSDKETAWSLLLLAIILVIFVVALFLLQIL